MRNFLGNVRILRTISLFLANPNVYLTSRKINASGGYSKLCYLLAKEGVLHQSVLNGRKIRAFALNKNHHLLPELSSMIFKYSSQTLKAEYYFPEAILVVLAGRFVGNKATPDVVVVSPKFDPAEFAIFKKVCPVTNPFVEYLTPKKFLIDYMTNEYNIVCSIAFGEIILCSEELFPLVSKVEIVDAKSKREVYLRKLRRIRSQEELDQLQQGTSTIEE